MGHMIVYIGMAMMVFGAFGMVFVRLEHKLKMMLLLLIGVIAYTFGLFYIVATMEVP